MKGEKEESKNKVVKESIEKTKEEPKVVRILLDIACKTIEKRRLHEIGIKGMQKNNSVKMLKNAKEKLKDLEKKKFYKINN